MSLHDELVGAAPGNACKVCSYLSRLPISEADEWDEELARPVAVVGNTTVVNALARRGVSVTESAVRRHRVRHAAV